MLSSENRLTDGASFHRAVRSGLRSGSRTVVVHLATADAGTSAPPRIGFVVSRAVGNSVVRNRVKRRLRHLAREHASSLPGAAVLVVRALPAAAGATSRELGSDLERCLARVLREVPA